MSKMDVTVSIDEEKYRTVVAYLTRKGTTFDDEVDKALDLLYSKVVPAAVKEYILMMKEGPEAVQHRRKRRSQENNQTETTTE